jgi:hypothetical protein
MAMEYPAIRMHKLWSFGVDQITLNSLLEVIGESPERVMLAPCEITRTPESFRIDVILPASREEDVTLGNTN